MDELIFTLTASLEGTNPALIRGAIFYVLPWCLLVLVLAIVLLQAFRIKGWNRKRLLSIGALLSSITIIGSLSYFGHRVGFIDYLQNQSGESSFIEEHYIDPANVEMKFPEKKRNLIYIFVESMEVSYADEKNGGGKEENLIPELAKIAKENEDFSGESTKLNGASSLFGATYTMGGLFAQTSGLPLSVPPIELAESKGFLPGITVLGDILEQQGYHNVFFIGTDASFGERGTYFHQHGNHDIFDFNTALENQEIPYNYKRPFWGYDDYILYENAKAHLLELAQEDQPFNFTMLTVDTHAEDGYLCDICPREHYDDPYADVFRCASWQAAEFIEWIQEQDFYEDTTIVVVGDHISMDSDFCDDIDSNYQRKNYSVYINAAQSPKTKKRRELSSMDNFPTVLASLGVDIKGDKLGLGVNAFSDTPTLLEVYGEKQLNKNLSKKSTFFKKAIGSKKKENKAKATYDETTGYMTFSVPKPLRYSGENLRVYCDLNHKSLEEPIRIELYETQDEYRAIYSLSNLGYEKGKYKANFFVMFKDNLATPYAEKKIIVE